MPPGVTKAGRTYPGGSTGYDDWLTDWFDSFIMALSQILSHFFLTIILSTWIVEVRKSHSKFLCLSFCICAGGNQTSGPIYAFQLQTPPFSLWNEVWTSYMNHMLHFGCWISSKGLCVKDFVPRMAALVRMVFWKKRPSIRPFNY